MVRVGVMVMVRVGVMVRVRVRVRVHGVADEHGHKPHELREPG